MATRFRICFPAALLLTDISVARAGEVSSLPDVSPWMVAPFLLLLLSIAIAPFINKKWWERHYPHVAVLLGLIVVLYYLVDLGEVDRPVHTAWEYGSFIALIGSLFVVAGGIHIRIRGKSTPHANVFLLAIGAVLSNIVGTTGASMILIRPFLRVNRYRIRPYHVVFFIFVVSNIGGSLTPVGDPPLFLGYLLGIPFFWILQEVWFVWLFAMACVLAAFYLIDLRSFRALARQAREEATEKAEEGEVSGLHNIFFLAVILVAVFITRPPFVREILMLAAAAGSYFSTSHAIHRKNDFNFVPITEVAILFLGIFATMMPALDLLQRGGSGAVPSAGGFYWMTGSLSSFLDNAPTYLNFLTAQMGLLVPAGSLEQIQGFLSGRTVDLVGLPAIQAEDVRKTLEVLFRYHYDLVQAGSVPRDFLSTAYLMANHPLYVEAISIAAVFFGACTYIGNGPNFMVKSIAEQAGVKCPSFFGYIAKYTLPLLLPVFALVWLLFFRG
jgi:Na+/H+ antiporter NhaD/arsenite permease-like protein